MDDVGQTLLNWASAFGTQEMVEFLCSKGADVNKGKVQVYYSSILARNSYCLSAVDRFSGSLHSTTHFLRIMLFYYNFKMSFTRC